MATTVYHALAVSAGGHQIHTGAGRLLGVLVSNGDAAAQTITFYDNTSGSGTKVLEIDMPAGVQPFYVMFPRDQAPTFSTGLYASLTAAAAHVWVVGY